MLDLVNLTLDKTDTTPDYVFYQYGATPDSYILTNLEGWENQDKEISTVNKLNGAGVYVTGTTVGLKTVTLGFAVTYANQTDLLADVSVFQTAVLAETESKLERVYDNSQVETYMPALLRSMVFNQSNLNVEYTLTFLITNPTLTITGAP